MLETAHDAQKRAAEYGIPFIDLESFQPDAEVLVRFPSQVLFRNSVLPLRIEQNRVRVAISDPLDFAAIDELTACAGLFVDIVVAEKRQIDVHLKQTLGVAGGTVRELVAMSDDDAEALQAVAQDEIDDLSQASSVVKLVNEFLIEAVDQQASDIHIEPEEDDLSVRFRVDGLLRIQRMPPEIKRFRAAIVSRLKIMARLNIAEKRLPQDGRIRIAIAGREVDIRVSVVPMLHGEGVVMRLLDKSQARMDLDYVRFPNSLRSQWNRLIRRSHGLLLVTGPTGSGKTTTLYSSLCEIRRPELKIITVEDPVEYDLRQISQIQVQNQVGLSFAEGLRSVLRHDPDVVLIGEVRDTETARSAVQASLTGHLVLTTLHTNDAPSAFTRLIDMGVEPYLVSSTVEAVLAQRLVRRLCPSCRRPVTLPLDQVPDGLELPPDRPVFEAVGCRMCHNTGYLGRTSVFELLVASGRIRKLCNDKGSASEIRQAAIADGMVTLRQMAWQKVIEGETTMKELLRICPDETD